MVLTAMYEIKAIKKKTQAKAFKSLQVGDSFELKYNLNGYYKGSPTVEVFSKGEKLGSQYASQLVTTLEYFELEEIDFERISLINSLIEVVYDVEGAEIDYEYYGNWSKDDLRKEVERLDYLYREDN